MKRKLKKLKKAKKTAKIRGKALVKKKRLKKTKKKIFKKIKHTKIKLEKRKSKKVSFAKALASRKKRKKKIKAMAVKIKRKKSKEVKKIVKKSKKKKTVNKLKVKKIASNPTVKRIVREKRAEDNFGSDSLFRAKIKVIGIGGGGGSIVSEIGRSLHKASFVISDTDVRAFRKKTGIKYFLFGQELTHGLGTGLNTELAKSAAESEKERIARLFEGQDIVILIACLGGGLGSGATKVFAEAVENFQGIVFGIFTLPFKFEGKNKQKIAYKALRELKKSLNVSVTIPNERIFKIIDSNTAITDAFSMVNKNLIESLESLIDLISSPGIINIDFADLKAILRGKGNVAFLNTAESSGRDSAQKIAEEILHNALYQNSNFTADKILFNILGGSKLSMFEVDKISRAIAEQNPKAKIIFGISKSSNYNNKIKTTLLMTGQGVVAKVAPKKVIVKKPVAVVKEKKPLPALKKAKKTALRYGLGQVIKKKKPAVKNENKKEKEPFAFKDILPPVFTNVPVGSEDSRKLSIVDTEQNKKRAVRRSALEIKEAEVIEENKKSKQEEEWEIPAFLRKVKFK